MKRNFLSLVSMVFIAAMTLTSCEEMMSAIDNPVGSYVQFPSTELTLQIGEDRPFQATTISPAKITYKSSDESVVTIDPQGFVTGIAFGEATITASVPATEYYAAGSATCLVKVAKKIAKVTKAPTANTGVIEKVVTDLVTAGEAEGGIMMYEVTETNTKPTSTGNFGSTVPTAEALNAGTYYVWYYVMGDDTHANSEIAGPVEVEVGSAGPSYSTPLTFEVISEGDKTIAVTSPRAGMYYKKNGGDQVALTAGVDATIDVTKGDKVAFYGTATSYFVTDTDFTKFDGTAQVNVYGNIMSLLSPTGFADNKTLSANYTFRRLFVNYTNLKDASNLFLPAITLTQECYRQMFQGCTSLTAAPKELPAESLANSCYYTMFYGCTSLTATPTLPAETLATQCYWGMFYNCTSLTTAPEKLPATTLATQCYQYMFMNCTSLTTTPKLPATTLASSCYNAMFNGCTNLTNAYVKAAYVNSMTNSACGDMFTNCTATGAKLHTTSDHKASWADWVMGSGKYWPNWTAIADWTD